MINKENGEEMSEQTETKPVLKTSIKTAKVNRPQAVSLEEAIKLLSQKSQQPTPAQRRMNAIMNDRLVNDELFNVLTNTLSRNEYETYMSHLNKGSKQKDASQLNNTPSTSGLKIDPNKVNQGDVTKNKQQSSKEYPSNWNRKMTNDGCFDVLINTLTPNEYKNYKQNLYTEPNVFSLD